MRACLLRVGVGVCVCCLVFVWFLKASPKLAPALAGPQADAGVCVGGDCVQVRVRHAARAFWRFSVGQRAQARELASHSSLLSCLRDVCVHTNTRTYAEIHAVRVCLCVCWMLLTLPSRQCGRGSGLGGARKVGAFDRITNVKLLCQLASLFEVM